MIQVLHIQCICTCRLHSFSNSVHLQADFTPIGGQQIQLVSCLVACLLLVQCTLYVYDTCTLIGSTRCMVEWTPIKVHVSNL